jgi:hypothetical protein
MKKAVEKDDNSALEVCSKLYSSVLDTTESHAMSFDSTEPSPSLSTVFKTVEKFGIKLTSQARLGRLLTPLLTSDTISGIVEDVGGKVDGHFKRNVPLSKLLFVNFHDKKKIESTVLFYNEDPKRNLTTGSFTIDPVHFSIGQQGNKAMSYHQLMVDKKKIDIASLATEHKMTGRRVVHMDGLDAKRFSVETQASLCLPLKSQVQHTINYEEMKFHGAPVKVKMRKDGSCEGYIPITLQRNQAEFFSAYV